MKIIYLHQYFRTPDMSGGTRSYEMARRFAAAGHDVHMVTTSVDRRASPGWHTEVVEGFTVHSLTVAYDNKMSYRRRVASFAVFAARSSRRARGLRGDVVLASSTPLTVAIPGICATLGRRSRMIFEVRDLWPRVPIALGALRNRGLQGLARWLERLAYRRSHVVVALSEGMAQGVREAGGARQVVVIPNSCDNDLFDVDPHLGAHFRQQRPWIGGRPLVVYAGTLGLVNGVGYMVELAHASLNVDPELRFLIMGDGAEKAMIEEMAAKLGVLNRNLYMEAPIPKRAMPAALSAADISCSWVIPVPELEANSANKFFDALAARTPVAINHGGWQADLIEERSLGLVLDPNDIEASAARLSEFLRDGPSRAKASLSANHLATADFDRDSLARKYIQILEDSAHTPTNRKLTLNRKG